MRASRYPLVLLLLAMISCGSSSGTTVDAGSVAVEIGTGTTEFEPLAEDESVVLYAGPQGGHHFIVHARVRGLLVGDWQMPGQIGNPATLFSIYNEAGEAVHLERPPYRLGYRAGLEEWAALPSGRIVEVKEGAVAALYGSRVRLVVEVRDVSGATGSDERWVQVQEAAPEDL